MANEVGQAASVFRKYSQEPLTEAGNNAPTKRGKPAPILHTGEMSTKRPSEEQAGSDANALAPEDEVLDPNPR